MVPSCSTIGFQSGLCISHNLVQLWNHCCQEVNVFPKPVNELVMNILERSTVARSLCRVVPKHQNLAADFSAGTSNPGIRLVPKIQVELALDMQAFPSTDWNHQERSECGLASTRKTFYEHQDFFDIFVFWRDFLKTSVQNLPFFVAPMQTKR
jgi:hypothetical protein